MLGLQFLMAAMLALPSPTAAQTLSITNNNDQREAQWQKHDQGVDVLSVRPARTTGRRNAKPHQRINNRVDRRVQNRVRNRVPRNYDLTESTAPSFRRVGSGVQRLDKQSQR